MLQNQRSYTVFLDISFQKEENVYMQEENAENPQIIFSWKAPLRPYKRRTALVLRFYLALALLLSGIVYFFGDKVLLLPIWALLFLFYILTITPPPEIENRITKFGVETANTTLRWEFLSYFYFSKRFGFNVLVLVSHEPYNYHAYLVIPSEEIRKNITLLLTEHLVYLDKPRKGITEKTIDFLSSLIPNDEEQTHSTASSKHQEEPHVHQKVVPSI